MLYDDNKNGRITCSEARAHGITPALRGYPAYDCMKDGINDGMVCEQIEGITYIHSGISGNVFIHDKIVFNLSLSRAMP